ncbi:Rieske (2Fe-2S) protein [Streptomyces sp. BR1]|uniref:Rieske (2Fe-2S) protein n=1 Tax=Streptomyces sp. BR1 TaxID=1592323 RepID=UPI00402BBF17
METATTRRAVLAAAAGSAALAGCGKSDNTSGGTGSTQQGAGGGGVLAKTSDIPVGGGKVFAAEKVVVTQPESGTFKAFSAICTHMGCTVKDVSNGTINCPCHGSKYRVADASVASGPAPRPLPSERITVENNSIRLA